MTLAQALRGVTLLAVDSSAFIDYAQGEPRSIKVLTAIFERIAAGEIAAVSTTITLAEVLTHAQAQGDAAVVEQYENMFRQVRLVPADETIARSAATLRVRYKLATPDALQLATALETKCQALLTMDAGDFLRASGEIRVIVPAKLTR